MTNNLICRIISIGQKQQQIFPFPIIAYHVFFVNKKGGDYLTGKEIRVLILASGFKLWQVAERFGCTDGNFSRKLRHDFSEADSERVLAIIELLKAEKPN